MPGPSPHALIWSEAKQHYELTTGGHPEHCFRRGDEPAWQSWLDEHTAFAFVGQAGRLSVLKEARPRGAGYWYAYRTEARHTRKRYLGPTVKVTFASAQLHYRRSFRGVAPATLPIIYHKKQETVPIRKIWHSLTHCVPCSRQDSLVKPSGLFALLALKSQVEIHLPIRFLSMQHI